MAFSHVDGGLPDLKQSIPRSIPTADEKVMAFAGTAGSRDPRRA